MEQTKYEMFNFSEDTIDGLLDSLFKVEEDKVPLKQTRDLEETHLRTIPYNMMMNQREKVALPQETASNDCKKEKVTTDSSPISKRRIQIPAPSLSLPMSYGFAEYQNYVLREVLCEDANLKTYTATHNTKGTSVTIQYGPTDAVAKQIAVLKSIRHENIAMVYRYSSNYILLANLGGDRLDNVIKGFGQLPEPLVKRFTSQILNMLNYLKKEKRTHGSIKPQLCFLKRDGNLIFSNLSHSTESSDNSSDVVDMGCLVISMATGLDFDKVKKSLVKARLPPIKCSDFMKDFVIQALTGETTCESLSMHSWFNTK